MKNITFTTLSLILLATASCKKNESGNKNVIVEEEVSKTINSNNGKADSSFSSEKIVKDGTAETRELTQRYVAEDGSSALVTFKNSDKENSISIRSNNKTITVPQKEKTANGAIYSGNDIEVKSEGDNVTITQGNAVIELRKAKGQ